VTAAYLKGSTLDGMLVNPRARPHCDGKVRFDSAALAHKASIRKTARFPYRCETCGGFHAGSKVNINHKHTAKLTRREQ
jgi:hypothetical protein